MFEKSPFNKWLAELDNLFIANFGGYGDGKRKIFIKKFKKSGKWKSMTPQAIIDDIKRRMEDLKQSGYIGE